MQETFRSQFRLPQDLADRLRDAAEASGRSMNAEVVSRLEQTFGEAELSEQTAALAADLAKAKRDAAYAAYISERWLVSLIMLWDIYQDVAEVVGALGLAEAIPSDWRETAEYIGSEADDEFKRHAEDFDPMVLHDIVEASEQEFQHAITAVVRLAASAAVPGREGAKASQAIRQRILQRKRREFLPPDARKDALPDQTKAATKRSSRLPQAEKGKAPD